MPGFNPRPHDHLIGDTKMSYNSTNGIWYHCDGTTISKTDFPLYAELTKQNKNSRYQWPVYVGKAVPAGARLPHATGGIWARTRPDQPSPRGRFSVRGPRGGARPALSR